MTETAYLAPGGFENELREELGSRVIDQWGRLFLARGEPVSVSWCQNIWYQPRRLPIRSIADAATQLRELAPLWSLYSHAWHRRAELIAEKVPRARGRPLEFLGDLPKTPPGSFSLLEPNLLLASPHCQSRMANGEVRFREDKTAPSRAYLKLWELMTVHGIRPPPGSRCLDLGSSPGGWTWVLQRIGAHVISVDKAPLDPQVAALPSIETLKADAFRLKPDAVKPVDWLFSDIICDPRRLWDLVQTWRQSGRARGFVCTLKFKGSTDHETSRRFRDIPGSRLLHLFHNKHELTWILPPAESSLDPSPSHGLQSKE